LAPTVLSTATLTLTGTGTINGLDSIDATGETTLEATLDLTGDVASTGLTGTVIQADAVALTTDTTGNYVATVTGGAGLTEYWDNFDPGESKSFTLEAKIDEDEYDRDEDFEKCILLHQLPPNQQKGFQVFVLAGLLDAVRPKPQFFQALLLFCLF
jgi:hypothetical protein